MKKRLKSMESESRRKERIANWRQLTTRIVEDKTKYNRAREKHQWRKGTGD